MIWHAVLDADGHVVSIGTVVADPLPKGLSVVSGDVADGQVPTVVDGALVGVAPPTPEVVPSVEKRLAAVERVLVERAMVTESELSMEVRR